MEGLSDWDVLYKVFRELLHRGLKKTTFWYPSLDLQVECVLSRLDV